MKTPPRRLEISDFSQSFQSLHRHHSRLFWGDGVFCQGSFDPHLPRIAIIGGRRPSAYGKVLVEKLIEVLSEFSINIVSGGALGIDSLAHRYALKQGLPTISWLVGPVESPSPRSNHPLFREIVDRRMGALLFPESLCPKDPRRVHKSFWLQRNLWLAAHSDLIVVVEALQKSGTWSTVKAANHFAVPVWAFPGTVFSKLSEGPNLMITNGYAHPIVNFSYLRQRLMDENLVQSYNSNRESRSAALKIGEKSPLEGNFTCEKVQEKEIEQQFHGPSVSMSELFAREDSASLQKLTEDGQVLFHEGALHVLGKENS